MSGRADRAKRLRAILVKVIMDSTGVAVSDNRTVLDELATELADNPGMPWSKIRKMYQHFGLDW